MNPIDWLFEAARYTTRSHCAGFEPWLASASQAADAVIAFAYYGIPACILYVWRARRNHLADPFTLVCFAMFILSCGLNHLSDIGVFYWAPYRFYVALKVNTAVWSAFTLLRCPGAIRAILKLPSRELLHAKNDELQAMQVARELAALEHRRQVDMVVEALGRRIAKLEDRNWSYEQQADIEDIRSILDRIRKGPDG